MATKVPVSTNYLIRVMYRRLVLKDVLPNGTTIAASHQMMSSNLHEPFQLFICPINQPIDADNEVDNFGTITNGVFHIYYRHRGMDDAAFDDDIWLNDPDTGYYATLTRAYRALNGWWPVGDLIGPDTDSKTGKLLTTNVLKCKTFNEPRRANWSDRTMGEGMFEIRARYILEVDTLNPLV